MSLRFFGLAFVLALAACSSPAKPTTSSPPNVVATPDAKPDDGTAQVGNHGAVCAVGGRHRGDDAPKVVECTAGLQCCYPCGIDGCDSVCMTQAECNVKRP
jgi:hypothetical protein